jgi:signal transduction histidine kinase
MKNKVLRMKYFNIIIEDTARLGKLITDILDLSRLDMGTMKFNIEEASVDELATAVKDLCDMGIKEKNLKSVYDIGKGIPKIQTDKSRITQVISNLLNNSMKYTEKGSIRLEIFKKDEDVHFRVTDTGVGIPIEAQPRIFERFFQADSSYTRKVGGSGLGLSICKGIVEALGGRIWFTSSDKGTIFEFLIPVANKVAGKTQNINTLDASK